MKKFFILFLFTVSVVSAIFFINFFLKDQFKENPELISQDQDQEYNQVTSTPYQIKEKSLKVTKRTSFLKEKTTKLYDLISQTGNKNPDSDSDLELTYKIVDTGITSFYSNFSTISEPQEDQAFYGQDAHYQDNVPQYIDNDNGTVTDKVTQLMWQQDMGEKMTYDEAKKLINNFELAGFTDWRIASIKDLYSLIQFTGQVSGQSSNKLFIDTKYFNQPLGNTQIGEREIDAQTWSSTIYLGKTMNNSETLFGVNFIDGRIKGYPLFDPRNRTDKKMYFRFVRGNKKYGVNLFIDNSNGTITDKSTGLMWQKSNSDSGMDWKNSLDYAQDLELAGYTDWRLPNAKELQSIIDYERSPQITGSASIDSIFEITQITDEKGEKNYPFFWTSTTHLDGKTSESNAVYISFGEALGKMNGQVIDVHGAGSQRSDPKSGNLNDYPQFFGPQGDVRRVFNYVRSVRTLD